MKKTFPVLIIALLFFSFTVSTFAQKNINKGFIKIEMTDVSADDPNMDSMLGFVKSLVTTFYFTKEKSLVSVSFMGGLVNTKTLFNNENSESLMLMDMMGQKYAIKMDKAEALEQSKKNSSKMDIQVFEGETVTILGMKCVKVIIKYPSNPDMKMTAYCTKDIMTEAKFIKEMDASLFPGFPLKHSISNKGMNVTFEATEFKDDFDTNIFNLSTDGYDFITMEEFEKKMGGMGGMGGMGF